MTPVSQSKPARALQWYGRAETSLRGVLAKQPDHAVARRFLRNILDGRSNLYSAQKRHAEAVAEEQAVVDYHEQLVCRAPGVARHRLELAAAQRTLARRCRDASRPADAADASHRAAAVLEDLQHSHPKEREWAQTRSDLAASTNNRSNSSATFPIRMKRFAARQT